MNDLAKKYDVRETKYDGGTNYIITNGTTGKSVSVAITDYGLADVQTDTGKYTYTGKDHNKAAEAVKRHIG